MDDQATIRESLARLTEVLSGIARTADAKNRERCPYKTVELRCTYRGGCQNQRRKSGIIHCAGDYLIEWSPAPNAQSPEPLE